MYFALAIGAFNTMRWMMCAAKCRVTALRRPLKSVEELCQGIRKFQ